jgi:hypothetical protein
VNWYVIGLEEIVQRHYEVPILPPTRLFSLDTTEPKAYQSWQPDTLEE